MTTVSTWAERRNWTEPHWVRFQAKIHQYSEGDDARCIATCECDWWSVTYDDCPTSAFRALWAHYLNPDHRWWQQQDQYQSSQGGVATECDT